MKKTAEIQGKSKSTQTPIQKKQDMTSKDKNPQTPASFQNKAPGNPTPDHTNTQKNVRPTPDGRITADKGVEGRNTALRTGKPNQEQRDQHADQIRRQKDPTTTPNDPGKRPDWPDVHAEKQDRMQNKNQQTGRQDPDLEQELGESEAEARRK